MTDYKRLTERGSNGVVVMDGCKTCGDCTLNCAYVEGALKRLAELEDKIENGTLIELGYHMRKSYRNHDDQRYKITRVEENDVEFIGYDGLKKVEAEQRFKELKNER